MFVVLLVLCVLMVVGAGVCLIALLGAWDEGPAHLEGQAESSPYRVGKTRGPTLG